jgi:hypothetical protein
VVRATLVAALLVTAAGVLYGVPTAPQPGPTGQAGPGAQADTGATPAPRSAALTVAPTPNAPPPDGRLPIPAGAVGVPVHLADPAALAVLRPGDRVDLLALADEARPDTMATGVLVLAVPDVVDVPESGVVFLALSPDQARRTVRLTPRVRFAVIVRG